MFDGWTLAMNYRHDAFKVDAFDSATFGSSLSQRFAGASNTFEVSAAYDLTVGHDLIFRPQIGLGYTRTDFDGFSTTAGIVDINTVNHVNADAALAAMWRIHSAEGKTTLDLCGTLGLTAKSAGGTTTALQAGAGDIALMTDAHYTLGYVGAGLFAGFRLGL